MTVERANAHSFTVHDQPHNGRVVARLGGRLIAIYHYHPYAFKPYIYPLVGPAGKNLTWDAPSDHPHHRSIWYAHHEVNGVDFYYEHDGEGRIVHRKFLRWWDGGASPGFAAANDWVAPDGRTLLSDERVVRFTAVNELEYYVDLAITLIAGNGPISFTDTKEAGLPLIRMADELDEDDGGVITAPGGAKGEQATFGMRAPWVDYSGTCGGGASKEVQTHGISIFDHPSNPNHPPGLFTRSYGPFSTREGFMFDGGCELEQGDRLTLCTRLYVHKGTAEEASIDEHFARYAATPAEAILSGD